MSLRDQLDSALECYKRERPIVKTHMMDAANILDYFKWDVEASLQYCDDCNSGRYVDLIPVSREVIDIIKRL